jgi:hypothetical protein
LDSSLICCVKILAVSVVGEPLVLQSSGSCKTCLFVDSETAFDEGLGGFADAGPVFAMAQLVDICSILCLRIRVVFLHFISRDDWVAGDEHGDNAPDGPDVDGFAVACTVLCRKSDGSVQLAKMLIQL